MGRISFRKPYLNGSKVFLRLTNYTAYAMRIVFVNGQNFKEAWVVIARFKGSPPAPSPLKPGLPSLPKNAKGKDGVFKAFLKAGSFPSELSNK